MATTKSLSGAAAETVKLTEEQVRALRAKTKVYNPKTRKQEVRYVDNRFPDIVAKDYGIDVRTLRRIRNGHAWKHIF
jgi:hypothetical protein